MNNFNEDNQNRREKGIFITIEGGEGSGKSTVIKALSQYLASKGIASVITREPGGNKVCDDIRTVILANRTQPWTEALLFLAARKEHCETLITPALHNDKIVICDRYIDSSLVYQAYVGDLDVNKLMNLHHDMDIEMPDYTILLDVDPKLGLQRIFQNEREVNRIDLEGLEFHQQVREGYLQLAKENPDRFLVLDASGDTKETLKKVIEIIEKILEGSKRCNN